MTFKKKYNIICKTAGKGLILTGFVGMSGGRHLGIEKWTRGTG
jgi:hypothetical protein